MYTVPSPVLIPLIPALPVLAVFVFVLGCPFFFRVIKTFIHMIMLYTCHRCESACFGVVNNLLVRLTCCGVLVVVYLVQCTWCSGTWCSGARCSSCVHSRTARVKNYLLHTSLAIAPDVFSSCSIKYQPPYCPHSLTNIFSIYFF